MTATLLPPSAQRPSTATRLCITGLLLALFAAPSFAAGPQCWRELRFSASNGWLGASSTLRYEAPVPLEQAGLSAPAKGEALQPRGPQVGKIHATFEAMSNAGELDTWFDPQTLAVLQTRRLSQGKNSRLKTHRFLGNGVWRERLEPADGTRTRDTATWNTHAAALIPYPSHPDAGAPVLTPVMLVARAAELVRAGRKASDQLVFTDTQLYQVRLVAAPADGIDMSFRLVADGKERRVREMRPAQRVAVMPRLLGNAQEKEAFSLLELTGDLAIFIDTGSGLPLRIQGTWLRVGTVPADLTRAELLPGCAG
jgi:hypothetical protein